MAVKPDNATEPHFFASAPERARSVRLGASGRLDLARVAE
jgi:hypothetical protein